jgi:hypothetical protein
MIVRDFSPIPYQGGKLPLSDRLRGIFQFGFSWPAEMESQDMVVRILKRSLDNSHTLLRNVLLPEAEITIPFVLISPSGVSVIYNSPIKGVFRAKGNDWEAMDRRNGSFRVSTPNLVRRTNLMKLAVVTFLKGKGYPELPVEGVLVLTDPGTHVDTNKPEVRVILIDALARFGARLMSAEKVIRQEERYKIIRAFSSQLEAPKEAPSQGEKPTARPIHSIEESFEQTLSPLQRTFNFSRRQWLVLAGFVLAEICILLIFLALILTTA